jgi:hypothetical protein
MYPLKCFKVRSYEMGLHFRGGEFRGLLGEGTYWFLDPLDRVGVETLSQRTWSRERPRSCSAAVQARWAWKSSRRASAT